MMKTNKKSMGTYLTLAAGILAVVSAIVYTQVMYTIIPVYIFLAAAVVLAVLTFVMAGASKPAPRIAAGFLPVIAAAMLACAAGWGTSPMVNQLGYVVSGLDGVDTITTYIIFVAAAVVGMVASIIASFLPMSKSTEA